MADQSAGLTPEAVRPPEATGAQWQPTEGERALVGEVDQKYQRWKQARRPHEVQWFINAAFLRGQHYVYWHDRDNKLAVPEAPSNRVRLPINRLQAKFRARLAKFLRSRAMPIVMPATSDLRARINARISTKALEYLWAKLKLEMRYRDALLWSGETDHGYWWFYWDPTLTARVKSINPETGQPEVQTIEAGDVGVEVGSPFEVLIADPSLAHIGDQPEILRIKLRSVQEIRARFPEKGEFVSPEAVLTGSEPGERYEQRIASLAPTGAGLGAGTAMTGTQPTHVVVKEWFEKPTAKYPQGRYAVVAGGVLLRYQEELPYGFADLPNPYPCVDFTDFAQIGQYWGTTILEQLVPIQKEYNLMRAKVAEHLRLMAFPKLLAARQHQIPDGVWTAQAGEFVEYLAHPNIPPPQAWVPPSISADVWRSIEALKTEFDDVSHIYPEAEGKVGGSASGFQTNLLQEATDQVHAPDVRQHELAIEEAAVKLRRIMKAGYPIPRMITVAGQNNQPEVIEFSAENIDENAEVRIQAGSGLPMLKGAKIQAIMELYTSGLLGDAADPEVRRRALTMLELGSVEDAYDYARRDEDEARLENDRLAQGQGVGEPDFWENHQLHYRVHTDQLKGSETESDWPEGARDALIDHVILHVKFQNPTSAIELAARYNRLHLVADLIQQQQAAAAQAVQASAPGPGSGGPGGAPVDAMRAAQGGGFPGGRPPGPLPVPSPGAAANGNRQVIPGGFGPRGTNGPFG